MRIRGRLKNFPGNSVIVESDTLGPGVLSIFINILTKQMDLFVNGVLLGGIGLKFDDKSGFLQFLRGRNDG